MYNILLCYVTPIKIEKAVETIDFFKYLFVDCVTTTKQGDFIQ